MMDNPILTVLRGACDSAVTTRDMKNRRAVDLARNSSVVRLLRGYELTGEDLLLPPRVWHETAKDKLDAILAAVEAKAQGKVARRSSGTKNSPKGKKKGTTRRTPKAANKGKSRLGTRAAGANYVQLARG